MICSLYMRSLYVLSIYVYVLCNIYMCVLYICVLCCVPKHALALFGEWSLSIYMFSLCMCSLYICGLYLCSPCTCSISLHACFLLCLEPRKNFQKLIRYVFSLYMCVFYLFSEFLHTATNRKYLYREHIYRFDKTYMYRQRTCV